MHSWHILLESKIINKVFLSCFGSNIMQLASKLPMLREIVCALSRINPLKAQHKHMRVSIIFFDQKSLAVKSSPVPVLLCQLKLLWCHTVPYSTGAMHVCLTPNKDNPHSFLVYVVYVPLQFSHFSSDKYLNKLMLKSIHVQDMIF